MWLQGGCPQHVQLPIGPAGAQPITPPFYYIYVFVYIYTYDIYVIFVYIIIGKCPSP